MEDPAAHAPDPIRNAVTTTRTARNWPMNCWWVVAHSSELSGAPVSRWALETPLVIYRRADGAPVALHDRCPHRWAPLSMGWVEEDNIVCGYHGMQFSPAGQCVKFPTLKDEGPKIRIASYPVEERYGFVWVWLGDAARADPQLIPSDIAYMSDPGWRIVWGYKAVSANYMQIQENVCDLSHFAFLHKNSAGVVGWDRLPWVKTEGERVTFGLEFDMAPLPPVYALPLGVELGTCANRIDYTVHLSPGVVHGWSDIENPRKKPGEDGTLKFHVAHLTTPVSASKCHYFWIFARNFGPPFDVDITRAAADPVFNEDVRVLEATQAMTRRALDQEGAMEFSIASDRAAIEVRRSVARLVRAELEAEGAKSVQRKQPA